MPSPRPPSPWQGEQKTLNRSRPRASNAALIAGWRRSSWRASSSRSTVWDGRGRAEVPSRQMLEPRYMRSFG